MHSFIDIHSIVVDKQIYKYLRLSYQQIMRHEFDLLGSGLMKVAYGLQAKGFEEIKYSSFLKSDPKAPYFKILNPIEACRAYLLTQQMNKKWWHIDWHIDFKSGFRYDAKKYRSKKAYLKTIGKFAGTDIKLPWELGRCNHLPRLATAALVYPEIRKNAIQEFIYEVVDFIAANPFQKTVQWTCAMDVAIRAINLLVAYDMLQQMDASGLFTNKFKKIFEKIIYQHGQFILNNLEYFDGDTSNHYLANIAGLTFIGAYLPENDDSNRWLAFGAQEIITEFKKQFHEDGTNFEASTSYHCLSLELVLYTTALLEGVHKTERNKIFTSYTCGNIKWLRTSQRQKYQTKADDFFPEWYIERLYKAIIFSRRITTPSGSILQVGDNDNGRLFKIAIAGKFHGNHFEENILDHRSLINAALGFFHNVDKKQFFDYPAKTESSFLAAFSNKKKYNLTTEENYKYKIDQPYHNKEIKTNDTELSFKKEHVFTISDNKASLRTNLKCFYYELFGLLILESEHLYLGIIVDTGKHTRKTGHMHNDNLSLEIIIDGQPIIQDPGTYIYTPSIIKRNEFRGVKAHNTIFVKHIEQNKMVDFFEMGNRARGYLLEFDHNCITLFETYEDIKHMRKIMIQENAIKIYDYCNQEFDVNFNQRIYSDSYGKKRLKK